MTEEPGVFPTGDEADELEQRHEVADGEPDDGQEAGPAPSWDADEADVAEQARVVPADDDEDSSPDGP